MQVFLRSTDCASSRKVFLLTRPCPGGDEEMVGGRDGTSCLLQQTDRSKPEQEEQLVRTTKYLLIYTEHHSVCPLVGIGTPATTFPQASVPSPPGPKGGGPHSPAAKGVREFQLRRRLEKKISTLPTQYARTDIRKYSFAVRSIDSWRTGYQKV
jgi:hypothetical protein